MSFMTEEEMLHKYDNDPRFNKANSEGYYGELARETQIKAGFTMQYAGLCGCCINEDMSEQADFYEAEAQLLQNIANSYARLSEMYANHPFGENEGKGVYYRHCEEESVSPYNPLSSLLEEDEGGKIQPKGFDTLGMSEEQEELYKKYKAGEMTREEYIRAI